MIKNPLNPNKMTFNQEKADEYIRNANRAIKIVELLKEGNTDAAIYQALWHLKADRQMISYYRKQLGAEVKTGTRGRKSKSN